MVDLVQAHPQGLAHVADGRARAVADHRGGQGGAVAAVLAVDVLDDLFAAFVLEVHVDVRRFAALPGHETLEQQGVLLGVHRGDAQAVAHGGIGRRATALAQDAPAACPLDNLVHGQKEELVAQLGDEPQFVLDLLAHLVRDALGVQPRRAALGASAQPAGRRVAGGHQLVGVFVAQAIQREIAAPGDGHGLFQQGRWVQPRQPIARPQVPLAIGEQGIAQLVQRLAQADGGERVLQRPPAAGVHVHIAAGHQGQAMRLAQGLQGGQFLGLPARRQAGEAQPGPVGEGPGHPGQRVRMPPAGRIGQPDQQTTIQRLGQEVIAAQFVAALGAAPAGQGDQAGQLPIPAPAGGQQHAVRAVVQAELRADDELNGVVLGGFMCPHHPGQGAFVGECQGGVAQPGGALDQLARVRGPAQEAEIADAMQFGVVGRWR